MNKHDRVFAKVCKKHYYEVFNYDVDRSNRCVAIAITLLSGLPYSRILKLCSKYGFSKNGGVDAWSIANILQEIGIGYDLVRPKKFYPLYNHWYHNEKYYGNRQHALLLSSGHVSAVVNGFVQDLDGNMGKKVQVILNLKATDKFKKLHKPRRKLQQ